MPLRQYDPNEGKETPAGIGPAAPVAVLVTVIAIAYAFYVTPKLVPLVAICLAVGAALWLKGSLNLSTLLLLLRRRF